MSLNGSGQWSVVSGQWSVGWCGQRRLHWEVEEQKTGLAAEGRGGRFFLSTGYIVFREGTRRGAKDTFFSAGDEDNVLL